MKKTYLLTPGPTPVPETISSIFARPLIHHRTPGFQKLFEEVRAGLKYVFQTKQEVLTLLCSGTGGMDAAVSNLFSPGDEIISINGGKFGARWAKIASAYGIICHEIKVAPGASVEASEVSDFVAKHPSAKAICFQASETSTGSCMPTEEIVEVARRANLLSVCDAITACGVFDLPMDEWGIDVMITGSQKAMMIPPGLAFIALSDRAWKANETAKAPRFYFDLAREKKSQLKNQTAWTPGTSLIQGLHEALKMIQEEGLQNVFKRHERLAQATRAAVQALGLEILATKRPSSAVTSVKVPSQIADGKLIPRTMRDSYGVTIAGGQDELEGKIFRLSHFGYCGIFDITTGISCLEMTLHDLGYPVQFGKGVGAALASYKKTS
ncbi:MAG: alanine--glyoxylate aminotransferase family protein [Bdellovibrionales bacterium]|nr:alanine--glyoxylate aminotransferase family protein [Bdellovibrionales bacterium]